MNQNQNNVKCTCLVKQLKQYKEIGCKLLNFALMFLILFTQPTMRLTIVYGSVYHERGGGLINERPRN